MVCFDKVLWSDTNILKTNIFSNNNFGKDSAARWPPCLHKPNLSFMARNGYVLTIRRQCISYFYSGRVGWYF